MAGANPKSTAPASFEEGANMIVQAISTTMMAPDAGPHLQLLEQLLKAVVGQTQAAKNPGGAGAKPAGPTGGGMGLGQMMGKPPSPPTAGPGGPPSPSSSTGVSADDLRRVMATQGAGSGDDDGDDS